MLVTLVGCLCIALLASIVIALLGSTGKKSQNNNKTTTNTSKPLTKPGTGIPADAEEDTPTDSDKALFVPEAGKRLTCWTRSAATIAKVPGPARECRLVPISPAYLAQQEKAKQRALLQNGPKAPALPKTPITKSITSANGSGNITPTQSLKNPIAQPVPTEVKLISSKVDQKIEVINNPPLQTMTPVLQTRPSINVNTNVTTSGAPTEPSKNNNMYERTPPSNREPDKAWAKKPKSLFSEPVTEESLGNNRPTLLLDYKDIRIDNRPITKLVYEPPEMQGPAQVPSTMVISGTTMTKVSPRTYFASDGGYINMMGVIDLHGGIDIYTFIVVTDKNLMNDGDVANMAKAAKFYLEQLQDDVYRVSGGRARFTKIYCGIVGFPSTTGSFEGLLGSADYDIRFKCDENEQTIIERHCMYAARKWGWDASYITPRMMFLPGDSPCTKWAGLARTSCNTSCNAFFQGHHVQPIPSGKGNPTNAGRGLILHEVFHFLGLSHASQGTAEYGDTTSFMGSAFGNAFATLSALHTFQIGWMSSVQIINIDTLTSVGTTLTLQDDPNNCIIVAAPVMICRNSMYTGFLPYPVICISITLNKIDGKAYKMAALYTYKGSDVNESMRLKRENRTFIIGRLSGTNKETIVETFDTFEKKDASGITIGFTKMSWLPPYVILDGGGHESPNKFKEVLDKLKVSRNQRNDMNIKIELVETFANGAMNIRVSKV